MDSIGSRGGVVDEEAIGKPLWLADGVPVHRVFSLLPLGNLMVQSSLLEMPSGFQGAERRRCSVVRQTPLGNQSVEVLSYTMALLSSEPFVSISSVFSLGSIGLDVSWNG